jgi:YHS domain-containing protein
MQAADDRLYHLEYAGHDYHFCSQHCLDKFQADPGEYTKPGAVSEINASLPAKTASAVKAVGIYTCPMHPEVRQEDTVPSVAWRLSRAAPRRKTILIFQHGWHFSARNAQRETVVNFKGDKNVGIYGKLWMGWHGDWHAAVLGAGDRRHRDAGETFQMRSAS